MAFIRGTMTLLALFFGVFVLYFLLTFHADPRTAAEKQRWQANTAAMDETCPPSDTGPFCTLMRKK